MTPGASYCGVLGCSNNSRKEPGLTYFVVPREEARRKTWVDLIGRHDILDNTGRIKYYVCSTHFSPEMWKNKRLRADAVPSICLPGSATNHIREGLKNVNIQIARPHDSGQDLLVEREDDHEDTGSTIIIKEEIDIDINEEDNFEEQLARKRKLEEEILNNSKKIKTEAAPENVSPYPIIIQPLPQSSTAKETELLPEFFMNKMISGQNEIITILKSQVLLQDPDPALLTFLRFVGAKLQRADQQQRQELQDKITAILFSV